MRAGLFRVAGGSLGWCAAAIAALPMARAAEPEPRPGAPAAPTATPPPAEAPPREEGIPTGIADRILKADSAFRIQNYPRVVELLDPLVGHPKLEGRPEHVKVLEWLGSAHWFTSNNDAARLVFGQLLREAPFHVLDERIYPEPLIDFFETRRQELIDARIIPARPTTPEPEPETIMITRTLTHYETPTIAYLVPFGVGQFANDEDGKGTAFAIVQGVSTAVMLATWIGIETLKVDGSDDIIEGQGDREAKLLNGLFIGAFGVFVASWAFSIVDGFANRRDDVETEERSKVRPGTIPPDGPPTTRLPIVPLLGPGPGDVGVGLGVRF